jgi:putative PIN family toxin of toxin-antitoxin system
VRVVLDTNVVLSALLWRGAPHQLLVAIADRPNIQLYSSATLLGELADVLSRPAIAHRLELIGRTSRDLLADYAEAIELVEPANVPRVVQGDVDDDHVIATAVEARADIIVSGDRRHLLPLGSHDGIAIIDVAEAIKRVVSGA